MSAKLLLVMIRADPEVGMHSNDCEETTSLLLLSSNHWKKEAAAFEYSNPIKKGESCLRAYSAVKVLDLKVIHTLEPCKSLHCILQLTRSSTFDINTLKLQVNNPLLFAACSDHQPHVTLQSKKMSLNNHSVSWMDAYSLNYCCHLCPWWRIQSTDCRLQATQASRKQMFLDMLE